mmetsp:Transcript_76203/g.235970  ORF Transcript_76203/g.235970 Transcript_76203/m.235970 type:complete len:93 (+) Transcript_76203:277-555(+)
MPPSGSQAQGLSRRLRSQPVAEEHMKVPLQQRNADRCSSMPEEPRHVGNGEQRMLRPGSRRAQSSLPCGDPAWRCPLRFLSRSVSLGGIWCL